MTTNASTIRLILMALCLAIMLAILAVTCFNTPGPQRHNPTPSNLGKPSILGNHQDKWGEPRLENEEAQLITPLNSSERANMDVLQERKQLVNPDSIEGEGWKRIKNDPQQPGAVWTMSSDENMNLMSQHKLTPKNSWATPMRDLVKTVSSDNQVALLFSTYSYLNSTLNWLIAAKVRCKPPVTNVIVVCYDMKAYKILMKREIPSIYINPNTLIHGRKEKFIFTMRLVVLMTVTSWGYDVIQYDADAIIIKNPRELFERHPNSDIVASRARSWPPSVSKKWGFVACMGVVLFRSTPKIEFLWNVTRNEVKNGEGDDQKLVNEAINNFGITWFQSGENSVDGVCKNGLRVTVLSGKDICRIKKCSSEGNREQTPYILHKLSRKNGKDKKINAIKMKVWWLTENWDSVISDEKLRGTEWLASLMT